MNRTIENLKKELLDSFLLQNREILDNYVILAVTDIEGCIKHVSTNLCNHFKYKPFELIDKNYEFLINKNVINNFRLNFNDVCITRSIWKGEVKHTTKFEHILWLDTIIQPLFDNENQCIGFLFASNDITEEKKLKKINEENILHRKYNKTLLNFMPSFSSAVLLRSPTGLQRILGIIVFTILFFIIWASFSQIDELVKAEGKIIPSDKIESISSFEGGIIEKILIKEGDYVKKDQPLVQLNDISFTTEYSKNQLTLFELKAKKRRLESQASGADLILDEEVVLLNPSIMEYEKSLFETNKKKQQVSQSMLTEKLNQKKNDLIDAIKKHELLQKNYELISQEMNTKKELVKERIISEIEFSQEMRKFNDLKVDLKIVEGSIPTIKSSVKELTQAIEENELIFKQEAKNELTTVNSEIERVLETIISLKDKVKHSLIVSPVDGFIKVITIKTIGTSVPSGRSFIEIVPDSNYFVSEVKVKPSEIGFLYLGQNVKIKFKAYDFSIYGMLDGEISYISPDSIFDEKSKEELYIINVKSDNNYLDNKKQLKIKSGMTVEVDILSGKKSVMDYLLKPILKMKQNSLTER
jgi:adhesin transport system membrane fusion protein